MLLTAGSVACKQMADMSCFWAPQSGESGGQLHIVVSYFPQYMLCTIMLSQPQGIKMHQQWRLCSGSVEDNKKPPVRKERYAWKYLSLGQFC